MTTYRLNRHFTWFAVCALLVACSETNHSASSSASNLSHAFAEKNSNLRVNLTDAPPPKAITEVIVDIDHVELLTEKGGKKANVIIAKNLGKTDLLQLRNGVLLPMQDLKIPQGVSVKQIRLVLKESGHYLTQNENRCDLQTPSAQHTGVKLIISKPILFEMGYSYSIVVDFDADHSIVLRGNGTCLLKPVLKLKSAVRVAVDDVDDDGNVPPGTDTDDLTDGTDDSNSSQDDGYDLTPENIDELTPEQLADYYQ
jgi:hypothetical protein